MLLLQEFIKQNPHDWEGQLKSAPYEITIKHEDGFVIFNYNLYNSDLSNLIVKECRGVILREDTFEAVCVPFYKFFNYGQEFADKIDWTTAKVQTKVDGSICKLWYDKVGELWRISTNGMINADNVKLCSPHINESMQFSTFGRIFRDCARLQGLDFDTLNKDYTYIFELTAALNVQVIRYKEDAIWHIGTRNNLTLEELNIDIGIQKPEEHSFTTLEEVVDVANRLKDEKEGFVVVDANWHRVKIKSPYYVAKSHYFNDNIAMSKLIEIFLSGDYDEFITYFPKYAIIIKEMEAYVNDRCEEIRSGLRSVKSQLYSKETIKYEFYHLVKDEVWGGYALKQFDAIRDGTYDVIGVREYVMKDVKLYQKLKEHLRTKGVRPDINEVL
jgi:hypothetical protein